MAVHTDSQITVDKLYEQISSLQPRLRDHIHVQPQVFRGERWFVLRDDSSGKHLRISAAGYALLGRFDGSLSVSTIHEYLRQSGTELSNKQVIELINNLHSLGALLGVKNRAAEQLIEQYTRYNQQRFWQRFLNPLVIRIPLLDPDRWLGSIAQRADALFGVGSAVLWAVIVGTGLLVLLSNQSEISAEFAGEVLKPHNLILLWLLYPLMKAAHEIAHGLCLKYWGGEVREMGITLLLFMPVPYVDASAASSFVAKKKRMLVSAAGIFVELFLAAAALILWSVIEPGFIRDCLFGIFTIGAISTVLFNANPLLKFDGYFVLQDLIEIPNLYTRSLAYYRYLFKRHVLGLSHADSPRTASGEAGWFLVYGLLSQLYRLILLLWIVLFLMGKFALLGAILGAWAILQQLVLPAYRLFIYIFRSPELSQNRQRSAGRFVAVLVVVLLLVAIVPLPHSTRVHGVTWVGAQGEVFAGTSGHVTDVMVEPGSEVSIGQRLFVLSNPALERDIAKLRADLKVINIHIAGEGRESAKQRAFLLKDRTFLEQQLRAKTEEAETLVVTAGSSGVFALVGSQGLRGRYYSKGELVGHIVDNHRVVVRAAVPESQSSGLQKGVTGIDVRLSEKPFQAVSGDIDFETPSANNTLASPALGVWGGGGISVASSDPEGITSIERVFNVQIRLPRDVQTFGVGGRAYVRFRHKPTPLAARGLDAMQRLFLAQLPG